jgi:hypothetical protein
MIAFDGNSGFVTRTGPQPAISRLQIFVVRRYSDTAHIECRDMVRLHFA